MAHEKPTVRDLQKKKERGAKITRVTAYDYPTALLVDRTGLDMILVGDSLGMVVLGYDTTLPVTMDEMIHHAKAVARGSKSCFLLGDMPFLSYQQSVQEAVHNAGRFLKEGGMDGVKIEGGREVIPVIEAVVRAGIPVSGHIGLTPQSAVKASGFKAVGQDPNVARELIEDALALEQAGCFIISLEAMPWQVAKLITERLSIPTIGIGSGPSCDGQSINLYDVVGLFERFKPKFVKRYANALDLMGKALNEYRVEVESGEFPDLQHSYSISDEAYARLLEALE